MTQHHQHPQIAALEQSPLATIPGTQQFELLQTLKKKIPFNPPSVQYENALAMVHHKNKGRLPQGQEYAIKHTFISMTNGMKREFSSEALRVCYQQISLKVKKLLAAGQFDQVENDKKKWCDQNKYPHLLAATDATKWFKKNAGKTKPKTPKKDDKIERAIRCGKAKFWNRISHMDDDQVRNHYKRYEHRIANQGYPATPHQQGMLKGIEEWKKENGL